MAPSDRKPDHSLICKQRILMICDSIAMLLTDRKLDLAIRHSEANTVLALIIVANKDRK